MSAQVYRFRDFTDGDPLIGKFADEIHALLQDERFETLSISQIVGAMEVIKIELILRLQNKI